VVPSRNTHGLFQFFISGPRMGNFPSSLIVLSHLKGTLLLFGYNLQFKNVCGYWLPTWLKTTKKGGQRQRLSSVTRWRLFTRLTAFHTSWKYLQKTLSLACLSTCNEKEASWMEGSGESWDTFVAYRLYTGLERYLAMSRLGEWGVCTMNAFGRTINW